MNENEFALGIEVEILFARNEQKDCNGKPDPLGKRSKTAKNGRKMAYAIDNPDNYQDFRYNTLIFKSNTRYRNYFIMTKNSL